MNPKINLYVRLLLIAFCVSSCSGNDLKNRHNIEKYVPIDLKKYNVTDFHFEKNQLTYDYYTPFIIYISFKVDKNTALEFFRSLNMLHYHTSLPKSYVDSICLGYSKPEEFWQIKPIDFQQPSEKKEENLTWWKPNKNNLNLCYAANYLFYNEYDLGKPVLCKKQANGRIVGQYLNGSLYILIECFMDFEDNKH